MSPTPFKNTLKEGYPFRVWALTMLLPAILFFGFTTLESDWRAGLFSGCALLLLGILLSLPALFFNLFVCKKIAGSNLNTATAKGYIITIGLGFVAATWGLLMLLGKWGPDATGIFFLGFGTYGSASIIGAGVFRLRAPVKELVADASFWE